MVNDAEGKSGPVWSTQDDPRVTPFGRFLRETHIDEFPQIINVLLGQMALVGPRPERPEMVQKLEWKIPNYSERTNVRPGITGLSQLKLPPDTDLESVRQKQIYDLYYVTQVSAWLDIRILASTAWLLTRALFNGALSVIALPHSAKVMSRVENVVGPDSELLMAHRELPPK
jgi:lipopolysaccharide/colanic/teichoic acid biosynthesis glycosyltransferase